MVQSCVWLGLINTTKWSITSCGRKRRRFTIKTSRFLGMEFLINSLSHLDTKSKIRYHYLLLPKSYLAIRNNCHVMFYICCQCYYLNFKTMCLSMFNVRKSPLDWFCQCYDNHFQIHCLISRGNITKRIFLKHKWTVGSRHLVKLSVSWVPLNIFSIQHG